MPTTLESVPDTLARSLRIDYRYCKTYAFTKDDPTWITQPFPVLAMIIGGKGMVTVDQGERTRDITQPMDPYFLPSYTLRRPVITHKDGFQVLVMGLSVEILGGMELMNLYDMPLTFPKRDKARLGDAMTSLHALVIEGQQSFAHIAREQQMLYRIFEIFMTHATRKHGSHILDADGQECLPAVDYLKRHYDAPLNLDHLYDLCHVSQSHFFRKFKALTGTSPLDYVKTLRIDAAQTLLLSTQDTIANIGRQVGWHDPFHFSRTFKRETGFSPRQFRNQIKLEELG